MSFGCDTLSFLLVQMVKNLPAIQETQVLSLGWKDSLEKGMATHSSILAWGIPWTEEPGRLQSRGLQRVRHDWATNINFNLVAHKGFLSFGFFPSKSFSWSNIQKVWLLFLLVPYFSFQSKIELYFPALFLPPTSFLSCSLSTFSHYLELFIR